MFLTSNRARKHALDAAANLETMILTAEGLVYGQTPPPSMAGIQGVLDTVDTSDGVSATHARLLRSEVEAYFAKLKPNLTVGSRSQVRGPEAAKKFYAARTNVLSLWDDMFDCVISLRQFNQVSPELVIQKAISVPFGSLKTMVNAGCPPESATDFGVQLLASLAAVELTSREFNFFARLRTEVPALPSWVSVTGRFANRTLAAFEVRNRAKVVNPSELGITVGDRVTWGGAVATVTAVTPSEVQVSGNTIAVTTPVRVIVESGVGLQLRTLIQQLEGVQVPYSQAMEERLSQPPATAADIRDLVAFLYTTLCEIDTPSAAVEATVARMGIPSAAAGKPLATALLEFAPVFPTRIKNAALSFLDTLKAEGFSRAENTILCGKLDQIFIGGFDLGSHIETIARAGASVHSTTGTREIPRSNQGR
jgi:hypothetical protein